MKEDRYRPMLSDLLEGSLPSSERLEVEAHLKTCESCRTTLSELTAVRDAAASLARLDPPAGVWDRVRDSIQGPSDVSDQPASPRPSKYTLTSLAWSRRWALAAALVFVVGTLALLYSFGLLTPAPPEGSPEWVSAELEQAETHYQNAIRGLEQIVAEGQDSLDPEVTAVLKRNLTVIEDAIVESRDAARQQPANQAAGESLLAALRQKVTLLQNTVLLINEIRKGQGDGAVNILNEMRESEPPKNDSPS